MARPLISPDDLDSLDLADPVLFAENDLNEGDRVRVTEGPLKDVEGTFIQDKPGCGRLVVSIGLLGRGVAVEVEAIFENKG